MSTAAPVGAASSEEAEDKDELSSGSNSEESPDVTSDIAPETSLSTFDISEERSMPLSEDSPFPVFRQDANKTVTAQSVRHSTHTVSFLFIALKIPPFWFLYSMSALSIAIPGLLIMI